ncbi:alpha/beta hydrolase [soil metagenome]
MAHPGIATVRELIGESSKPESTLEERRAWLESLGEIMPPPRGVIIEDATLGGRPASLTTPGQTGPGTILYLHGGAYVSGSLISHRGLVGRLALAAKRTVHALDYRLGPEDPFPAGLDDAVAAFRELDASGAGPIAIAGDSAGGGLALAALLALRDEGGTQPAAGVCFSPWADLTQSGATFDTRADADPLLGRETLGEAAAMYLGDGDPTDPLASPMLGDLSGLPPVMIEVGDGEVLLDDARVVAQRIEAAGGEVDLEVWPEMLHVFQAFPPDLIPEADQSLLRAGRFLESHLT